MAIYTNYFTPSPAALKNSAPQEISDDAAEVDFSIDPDTVRKWLKKASELDKDGM